MLKIKFGAQERVLTWQSGIVKMVRKFWDLGRDRGYLNSSPEQQKLERPLELVSKHWRDVRHGRQLALKFEKSSQRQRISIPGSVRQKQRISEQQSWFQAGQKLRISEQQSQFLPSRNEEYLNSCLSLRSNRNRGYLNSSPNFCQVEIEDI